MTWQGVTSGSCCVVKNKSSLFSTLWVATIQLLNYGACHMLAPLTSTSYLRPNSYEQWWIFYIKLKVSFKQRFMLMLYANLNWICRIEWDFQRESKSRNWVGSNAEVQNNATLNRIMVKMKWGWFFYGKCCKTFWFKCAAKVCLKIICTHSNFKSSFSTL